MTSQAIKDEIERLREIVEHPQGRRVEVVYDALAKIGIIMCDLADKLLDD